MCKPDSLRILVASAEAAERFGLTIIVDSQPDMEVVAQAGSTEDVAELLLAHSPDVALIDASLVDGCVTQALERLRQRHLRCRVLVLAMYAADQSLQRALQAGAEGYVLKGTAHCDLLRAIRTVSAGGPYAHVVNPSPRSRKESLPSATAPGGRDSFRE